MIRYLLAEIDRQAKNEGKTLRDVPVKVMTVFGLYYEGVIVKDEPSYIIVRTDIPEDIFIIVDKVASIIPTWPTKK